MIYIKSLPPKNNNMGSWTYNRFGEVIPKEETEIETLKDFFKDSPLTEEKLLAALRSDNRVVIETEKDKEANEAKEKAEKENSVEYKIEQKTIKDNKKSQLQTKIDKFNEEKQSALETETKEDDLIVAEKEKELMKEIKEVENGSE